MAIYSVDSDAVLSTTTAVRGTIDRLQSETHAMLAQLTQLQSTWTGTASTAGSVMASDTRVKPTGALRWHIPDRHPR